MDFFALGAPSSFTAAGRPRFLVLGAVADVDFAARDGRPRFLFPGAGVETAAGTAGRPRFFAGAVASFAALATLAGLTAFSTLVAFTILEALGATPFGRPRPAPDAGFCFFSDSGRAGRPKRRDIGQYCALEGISNRNGLPRGLPEGTLVFFSPSGRAGRPIFG